MSQVQTAAFNSIGAMDQWMKTISNNITGSTVNGFKGTELQFGAVLDMTLRGSIQATDTAGSINPMQSADSGTMVTGSSIDFSQGSVTQTQSPTDLAINGDAMFIVSKVPVPQSMSDLEFTRNGNFHFDQVPGPVAGTGTYRLVNGDGMFVMGWSTPNDPTNRPSGFVPQESSGTGIGAFNTVAANGNNAPLPVQMQNIQLDMVRNPNAAGGNVSFKPGSGQLQVGGADPVDLAGNQATMSVTLAKFANVQGLNSTDGANFTYNNVAGQIFAGTANNAQGGVIGGSNVITPQALEAANTSINTVMPELTLAQKSFTATTKIDSVANGMIDDVNQLVK